MIVAEKKEQLLSKEELCEQKGKKQAIAREGMDSTTVVLQVHGIPPKAKEYKHMIRERLGDKFMVIDAWRRVLTWYDALKPTCSFRRRALVYRAFSPPVSIGLVF
ncbi:hypothetical protein MTR_2g450850 [Medicago truncatula]|uniref:Uncharacterized protein n=1 Tax=Medicago truncatula TaxID=3880 RepID=A0A072V7Y0_MEDTR|nr:hypothetical protein MTR_2g450850 [Medicago truncatula]